MSVASGVAAPAVCPCTVAMPWIGPNADILRRIVDVWPRFHRSPTTLRAVSTSCQAADIVQTLAIAIPLVILHLEIHVRGSIFSWLRQSKELLLLRLLHRFRVAMSVASGVAAPAVCPCTVAMPWIGPNADILRRIVDVWPRFHRSATTLRAVSTSCQTADV